MFEERWWQSTQFRSLFVCLSWKLQSSVWPLMMTQLIYLSLHCWQSFFHMWQFQSQCPFGGSSWSRALGAVASLASCDSRDFLVDGMGSIRSYIVNRCFRVFRVQIWQAMLLMLVDILAFLGIFLDTDYDMWWPKHIPESHTTPSEFSEIDRHAFVLIHSQPTGPSWPSSFSSLYWGSAARIAAARSQMVVFWPVEDRDPAGLITYDFSFKNIAVCTKRTSLSFFRWDETCEASWHSLAGYWTVPVLDSYSRASLVDPAHKF